MKKTVLFIIFLLSLSFGDDYFGYKYSHHYDYNYCYISRQKTFMDKLIVIEFIRKVGEKYRKVPIKMRANFTPGKVFLRIKVKIRFKV